MAAAQTGSNTVSAHETVRNKIPTHTSIFSMAPGIPRCRQHNRKSHYTEIHMAVVKLTGFGSDFLGGRPRDLFARFHVPSGKTWYTRVRWPPRAKAGKEAECSVWGGWVKNEGPILAVCEIWYNVGDHWYFPTLFLGCLYRVSFRRIFAVTVAVKLRSRRKKLMKNKKKEEAGKK